MTQTEEIYQFMSGSEKENSLLLFLSDKEREVWVHQLPKIGKLCGRTLWILGNRRLHIMVYTDESILRYQLAGLRLNRFWIEGDLTTLTAECLDIISMRML